MEAVDGAVRTRLIVEDKDYGSITLIGPGKDYFDYYMEELLGRGKMPVSLEEELHPTRMVIRAQESEKVKIRV